MSPNHLRLPCGHSTTAIHSKKGGLLAVNLGDDADTTGAIYGQLAGAYYGEDGIPEEWRSKLAMRDLIERVAERLYELKQTV